MATRHRMSLHCPVTSAPAVERDSDDPIILEDVEDSLSPETQVVMSSTSIDVRAWDPYGDNGSENDAQAPLAIADGSRDTAWSTECYSDRYLGAKPGVGLVISLPELSNGRLEFETLNAPSRSRSIEPTRWNLRCRWSRGLRLDR